MAFPLFENTDRAHENSIEKAMAVTENLAPWEN